MWMWLYTAYALCFAFIILVIRYIFVFLKRKYADARLINRIPGPKGDFLFGMAIKWLKIPRNKRMETGKRYVDDFGKIFKVWLGPIPAIVVLDPEYVKKVLSSSKHIDKTFGYSFFREWLGTGLLISNGQKWHQRRKMLTPTFHFSILETFFTLIANKAKKFNEKLQAEIDNESFDIFPYITSCTLDIICETAMGVKMNAQDGKSEYLTAVKEMNRLIIHRVISPWYWPDFIYRFSQNYRKQRNALSVLHGLSSHVLRSRQQERRNQAENDRKCNVGISNYSGSKKRMAFLDLLLNIAEESRDELTDTDIREEIDTFIFEGHDTTSSGIMWAIFLIGSHPNIQETIYQELKTILDNFDSTFTMEQINKLVYLDRTIRECLRLFPPVPFISRRISEEIELGGYTIPAGTLTQINIFRMHRHPDVYANPEVFNPDNFLPENVVKKHPFSYIPFSAGPRNCIGQRFAMIEMKLILSTFLRKYRVVCSEKLENLDIIAESILRSENGLKVTIYERNLE